MTRLPVTRICSLFIPIRRWHVKSLVGCRANLSTGGFSCSSHLPFPPEIGGCEWLDADRQRVRNSRSGRPAVSVPLLRKPAARADVRKWRMRPRSVAPRICCVGQRAAPVGRIPFPLRCWNLARIDDPPGLANSVAARAMAETRCQRCRGRSRAHRWTRIS